MGKRAVEPYGPARRRRRIGVPTSSRIGTFQRALLEWYSHNGRRLSWRRARVSKYYLIVAEVLLQRTTVRAVEEFLPSFHFDYPNWRAIADTSVKRLARSLKPLGLHKRRGASLRALAEEMVQRRGRFPRKREAIEALPGVGQYIANAIELFVHDRPLPLLDVNMARLLERYFGPRSLADIRYDPYLQELARRIVACHSPRVMNWATLDFAALVCRAKHPICEVCPLSRDCRSRERALPCAPHVRTAGLRRASGSK